jgi:hypothetical protein
MADLTIRKQCSRCPREELVDISIEQVVEATKRGKLDLKGPVALVIRVDGEELVKFETLCTQCRSIVARSLAQIEKKSGKKSSLREK